MTYETQIRATFEDTIKNQDILRKKIDTLIEENRPIKNNTERNEMFDLLSRATLGLGTEKIMLRLTDKKEVVEIDNLEQFITGVLFYYDKNIVDKDFFYEYNTQVPSSPIDIKVIWMAIRFHLLSVYPFAKAGAIRISKEQKKSGSGKGYYAGPSNITRFTEES